MRVGLGLLAISTALNVLAYELGEAGPPIVRCHELAGFEVSQVAGRGVIVAPGDNVAMKGSSGGNVHAVLVSKKVVTVLKVGKVRAEVRRDVAFESLKGLFYEWVDSGGVSDVGSEGAVNDLKKHCIR